MSYSQEACRLALGVGFEEKDLHNFGRLLEGLVVAAKVEEQMATHQQVKSTALFAIAVGAVTMGVSNWIAMQSMFAGALTFVFGLTLTGIGGFKIVQATKASG